MTGRFLASLILPLALLAPALAQDSRNLPPVLNKAISAASTLRYAGVRTVEFRQGPDRISHDEYIIRDQLRSRVEFPASSPLHGQVIVEDDRERRHYFPPPANEIRILPPRHVVTISRLSHILSRGLGSQNITTAAGERIAGIQTQQVTFADRRGNVAQRLWIDPDSGLILRREMFEPSGSRVGFFEFKRVNFKPRIRESDFRIERRGAKVITPEQETRRLAEENRFSVRLLPRSTGFHLEAARIQKFGDHVALTQIYSGPRGRLSLFQTRSALDPERLKRFARGDYRVYVWQRGDERFALVGELDEAALRELAGRLGDQ
jgi:hypothetical protein